MFETEVSFESRLYKDKFNLCVSSGNIKNSANKAKYFREICLRVQSLLLSCEFKI